MRFTRGFLAGLGAATSLVLAGSLSLLALSTVIAFRGWPEMRDTPAAQQPATLSLAQADAGDAATERTVKLAPRPRPVSRASVRQRPAAPRRAADRAVTGLPPAQPATRRSEIRAPQPSTDGGSQRSTDAAPERDEPAATAPLANTVRDATGGLADTLEPVSPTLGETVSGLGETVGTTVDGVGEIASGLVGGLLGNGARQP